MQTERKQTQRKFRRNRRCGPCLEMSRNVSLAANVSTSGRWKRCSHLLKPSPAMLDPKFVREHPDEVKQATRIKGVASPELVDAWLTADERRRAAQAAADKLKSDQKNAGEKMRQKLSNDERAELQTSLRQLKEN